MKDDTISRRSVIKEIDELLHTAKGESEHDLKMLRRVIKDMLPSAQQWTPCSERMPEEHKWIGTKKFGTTISNEVYVTFEAPDGERFATHIKFQNGKLSSVDEQRMKVWYKGAKPIAWCPLPEPYKEHADAD